MSVMRILAPLAAVIATGTIALPAAAHASHQTTQPKMAAGRSGVRSLRANVDCVTYDSASLLRLRSLAAPRTCLIQLTTPGYVGYASQLGLKDLSWRGWGGGIAVGTGLQTPSMGPAYKVTIRLMGLEQCGANGSDAPFAYLYASFRAAHTRRWYQAGIVGCHTSLHLSHSRLPVGVG